MKKAFTLTELMIAVVIISISMFGVVEAFKSINMAIQFSKDRAIATNLAQEKMQIIKQMIYYKVIPSTSVSYLNDFNPPIPYDNLYFPPETILEAGVYYKRYTYILPITEVSGQIVELAPQSPDTGMKKIMVTVVWQTGNKKGKVQLSSIYTNRDTVMANARIFGRVRDATTFIPISGAFINIAEHLGVRAISDNNGDYSVSIVPGRYTVYVEARGYFPYFTTINLAPEQGYNLNIDLKRMEFGTLTGNLWLRDHLVISQIVGSTLSPTGFEQEYIEIYNPTTYSWLVNGNIGLRFQRIYDNSKKEISINYINDYIQPNGFYLFANTTPLIIGGNIIHADAVWSSTNSNIDFPYFNPPTNLNIIPVFGDGVDEGGGAIELYRISDGKILDQVGWNRNDGQSGKKTAPFFESSAIQQNIGLQKGEQYVRYSSTFSVSSYYGPAYDSNNNSVDFEDILPLTIYPRNSSNTLPLLCGTPAIGSIVSCNDGLSISSFSYLVGFPRPYAYFQLNEVATGTWMCIMSSSSFSNVIDSITFVSGSTISLGNVFLSSSISWGYISGMVTDIYGSNITPAIKIVSSDGNYTYVSNKRYLIKVTTSPVDINVNPGNLNPSYVEISSNNISFLPGEIKSSVDFVLYQGGRITGKVLIAGSTIPAVGVAVAVYDIYDVARDQQITNNQGVFITNVLSTGTYIVQPVVDAREVVIPSTISVTLNTAGNVVFSTTFTISNALGYIEGNVRFGGKPIRTGTLIAVTTTTFSGIPPSVPILSSSTLVSAPIYFASSDEEGKYKVELRQSTNPAYNVYVYYPHLTNDVFQIYWSSKSGVRVWAGQTTGGIDFSW